MWITPVKHYSLWVILTLFLGYQFFLVISGFYFTGDTVSHLEMANWAKPGGLITLIRLHSHDWPPLMTLVLNLLKIIPGDSFFQARIFTFLFFSLNFICFYLLVRELLDNKIKSFLITTICLFGGIQVYLLRSVLSEQLFLLLWITGTLCLFRFFRTKQIPYFIFATLSIALTAVTKYIGVAILASYWIINLAVLFKNRTNPKLKLILLIILILGLLPFIFWLINSYIDSGLFLPKQDQRQLSFSGVALTYIGQIIKDIGIPATVIFTWGWLQNSKKQTKIFLIIIPIIFYYFILIYMLANAGINENFSSRFTGLAYPMLLLSVFLLGNNMPKLQISKRVSIFTSILIFVILFFIQGKFFMSSPGQKIIGAEYSMSIKQLCAFPNDKPSYLLIQLYSRNWVGQSLKYYCPNIIVIPENTQQFLLLQNGILYTPYMITNEPSLEKVFQYLGEKTIYLYRVKENFNLPISEIRNHLNRLD